MVEVSLHTKFGFLNFKVPNDIWFVCATHQIWFEMFFFNHKTACTVVFSFLLVSFHLHVLG